MRSVRYLLGDGGAREESLVSLAGLGLEEQGVSAVETVQESRRTVTRVELEMMEVVELWRVEEGQVITAVVAHSAHFSHQDPQPQREKVGTNQQRTKHGGGYVGH